MAKRSRSGELKGAISKRVQAKNPVTGKWVKLNVETGRIVSHKKTPGPYKNVRKKGN